MNRREFSVSTAAALGGAGSLLAASAQAQGQPVEGTNYVRLAQPAPVSAPAGKVEVVEFFWYGCPHCFHFEPFLESWAAKLPAEVAFRRIPVAFRERPFGIHQQLYFTIEAMGLMASLHPRVFKALHEERQRLDTPEAIGEFVARHGVDRARFMDVFSSFAIQTKCRQARSLTDAYRIDGVPAIGVAGRFYTSISLNGTPARTLATTDHLIQLSRRPA
ncbi:thiol:disulfide interchange protein DsbA/DsbL [Aquabacterium fontiphilum]|jgi:thiol:disulfide interchange protein DsbA|uniref:thiol:disulfide interchange protein DsbA/DsbL n=1 Tax=Aquabacterium fontiphilum TaxID=450365 RepID=UPI00137876F6|nr:thiol:disulfide interchange protein DsbA/DsbL [Aquabacterium fontiphilum]NBD21606.1 thiol:disulfide interchange protein DsbA/DsbL [Aquabacterium fontiphilum]